MTTLEDRLRDAVHAKAIEVPPSAVPPLDLPGRRRFALPGRARFTGWTAPIAAAAAVAVAVAGSYVVARSAHLGRPSAPPPTGAAAFPDYYVALTFTGDGRCCRPGKPMSPVTDAEVRATRTGRVLQTIAPPKGYQTFAGVTAAADDTTFVLAAQRLTGLPAASAPATRFFMLKLVPGGRARLTALPITAPPHSGQLVDMALSPDGSHLAATVGSSLWIFSTATGTGRTWRPSGIGTSGAVGTQGSLSWTANGRVLAFIYWGEPDGGGVRLLDPAAPGSSLLTNSRLAVGQPKDAAGDAYWLQARITPDGKTVLGITDPRGKFSQRLVAYSARTGKVLRVLSDVHFLDTDNEQVQWSSPSGDRLIITNAKPGTNPLGAPFVEETAGVLTGRHYTPLPWSSRIFQAAW